MNTRTGLAAALLLAGAGFSRADVAAPPAGPPVGVALPPSLTSTRGAVVDVAQLARDHRLVIVTLKAPWCPVCSGLLVRLKERLDRFRACGVTFVVLGPGPAAALARVEARTGFPYPFVADERLELARRMNLVLGPDMIQPALLVLNAEREVVARHIGRGADTRDEEWLLERFKCDELASRPGLAIRTAAARAPARRLGRPVLSDPPGAGRRSAAPRHLFPR